MFFFLAQDFHLRMIKGINANDYLTEAIIFFIHEHHTLLNSFVASLIEGKNYEEIYQYKSMKATNEDKVKTLNKKKKSIDHSLSHLKVWSTCIVVSLGILAASALYAGYREQGVFAAICSGLILCFSLMRAGMLTNRLDAIDKQIKEISVPHKRESKKFIFFLILLGAGIAGYFNFIEILFP